MAVDDRGIVVGITSYPNIGSLQGPELDAEAFYDWLTSPTGGDVPTANVEKIVSSSFLPVPPAPHDRPAEQEVKQAFDRLQLEAFVDRRMPKRLGRRLYVYVAGHGAALPFIIDPERSDAALLVADANPYNANHVMTKIRALYFLSAGIFDEIAVFMDCCRNNYSLNPNYPNYMNAVDMTTLADEPRKFLAFATRWGLNAREKQFDGVTRGIFTTALVAGLKGAAADPDGTINSTSLRNYLINHMKDLLTPQELQDTSIQKRPDVPPPAVDMVFATVPPQRVTVRVIFPTNAANQLIRVRGEGFKVIAKGQTVAGVPWVVPDPLERGNYLVEIPALNLEQDFTLVGNERTTDVVIN
jgi:hypothetical protein